MKERLLLEEKQRKQMESELSKLKKNLRESENVVEVNHDELVSTFNMYCVLMVLLSQFHSTGKAIYEGRSFKRISRIWSSNWLSEITRVKKVVIWSESYHG
jgi:hypothetical protein